MNALCNYIVVATARNLGNINGYILLFDGIMDFTSTGVMLARNNFTVQFKNESKSY